MKTEEYALQIDHLNVMYRSSVILWDVHLKVPSGQMVGILGPNGAGKSTLLKSIIGAVRPASGRVLCLGKPYAVMRKRIAYVPQRNAVDWEFPVSVFDVVSMGCFGKRGLFRRLKREDHICVEKAIDDLGLTPFAHRQIGELSGGQQQKVFIARALVQQADMYLLDEPFAGIDATTENGIMELLRVLKKQGKSIILVHHDLHAVQKYFDFVILLNTSVIAAGNVNEVFKQEQLKRAYGEQISFFASE